MDNTTCMIKKATCTITFLDSVVLAPKYKFEVVLIIPVYTMGYKEVTRFTLELSPEKSVIVTENEDSDDNDGEDEDSDTKIKSQTRTLVWDVPWFTTISFAIAVRTYIQRDGAMMASIANGSANYSPMNVIQKIEVMDSNNVYSKLDVDEDNFDRMDMSESTRDKLDYSRTQYEEGFHVFWKQH
ncbi:MAG: hypothetical protein ACTSUE_19305 [Promethearchaeota archaeon]